MKIRRAATLVCTFESSKPVVHNFLNKEMFECNTRALEILAVLDNWLEMEDALARLPEPEAAVPVLRDLIQRDLVLIDGSPQAERDQEYRRNWRWGAVSAFYHFSLRDSKFIDGEAMAERMREFAAESDSPPLLLSNSGLETIDLPVFDRDDPFNAVLYQRRSRREFSKEILPLAALADCLFAAKGVKSIKDGGDFGQVPLTMTPSGGARNPFELYVQSLRVDGLRAGFHHYSAAEHSLGFLHDRPAPPLAELLGNQAWASQAAAVVYLCARFDRSAWKYRQALAYRVVLMEIGAILQNLELVATRHGVAAAPSGALAESEIEALLGLDGINEAALFAVALGMPA